MPELIGVTIFPRFFKKHLLFFDRIAFPNYSLARAISQPGIDESVRDLEWLVERGLVFAPGHLASNVPGPIPDMAESFGAYARAALMKAIARDRREGVAADERLLGHVDRFMQRYAEHLQFEAGLNAVPMITRWRRPADPVSKTEVLHIIINEFPFLGDGHSFEDVLAFREEARSDGLIPGLRVWINDMASGKLTRLEVSDKLEDLINRYERALKLERMARTTGVLETVVVSTAEIAELLVKFQWSTLAKKLFEVRHTQVDLMKAEMTLPGREVAYIVKARERFG